MEEMDVGVGDQNNMFGYASEEVEELYALDTLRVTLTDVRKGGELWWLRPDGKTQVANEYKAKVDVPRRRNLHTVRRASQGHLLRVGKGRGERRR